MPGNSSRQGAVRKQKKGAQVGSGGQRKRALSGKGPTPPAPARTGHPAARRAASAERRATAVDRQTGGSGRPAPAGRSGRANGPRAAGAPGGAPPPHARGPPPAPAPGRSTTARPDGWTVQIGYVDSAGDPQTLTVPVSGTPPPPP